MGERCGLVKGGVHGTTLRGRPRSCIGRIPLIGVRDRDGGHTRGMGIADPAKRAAGRAAGHRISTRPAEGRVRVEHDGVVLAESDRAVALDETGIPTRYYLPREDVRTDLLEASDTTSHCPFKGDATYVSAPGAPDAFWVYEDPSEDDARPVAGMLAPWPGRVEVTTG